jgi:hypothetical protein
VRFAIASVMLLFIWANPAAADLYRWVDPETGSVKFSSYPPPWFGDAAKQRRAPKVEVIAPIRTAPEAEPTAAAKPKAAAQAEPLDGPGLDPKAKPDLAPPERRE